MAISAVIPLNQFEGLMLSDASRQWDDATAGNIMYVLADETWTPLATHTTTNDVGTTGAAVLTVAGDYNHLAATTLAVDAATTAGTSYLQSDAANFGASVSITAKYLIAIQPVVANTYALTSKLLWYVDLDDTTTGTTVSSVSSNFAINQPTNGWVSIG